MVCLLLDALVRHLRLKAAVKRKYEEVGEKVPQEN
jgi:hypothetical protein